MEIVNKLVYKCAQETAPSAVNRPNAGLLRRVLDSATFISERQIVWFDIVDEVKLYHERGDFSSLNTAYILAVWKIVVQMVEKPGLNIQKEHIDLKPILHAYRQRKRDSNPISRNSPKRNCPIILSSTRFKEVMLGSADARKSFIAFQSV